MKIPEGMNDLLKRAQELQSKLAEVQAEAATQTVEASAGGGMVTAVANGKLQIVAIRIEPQVFTGGDREMLEDLVTAAVNEAIRKAQQLMADAVSRVTGGLKIPGLTGG